MQILRARLLQMATEQHNSASPPTQGMVGSGDRARRSTYNYPQTRITDHRLGLTCIGSTR